MKLSEAVSPSCMNAFSIPIDIQKSTTSLYSESVSFLPRTGSDCICSSGVYWLMMLTYMSFPYVSKRYLRTALESFVDPGRQRCRTMTPFFIISDSEIS